MEQDCFSVFEDDEVQYVQLPLFVVVKAVHSVEFHAVILLVAFRVLLLLHVVLVQSE